MKVIFLDIDFVINSKEFHDRTPLGHRGISDTKIKLLKEIVTSTSDTKIVLISSWKNKWFKDNTKITDPDVLYLIKKFQRHKLPIFDKTTEDFWANRGHGIMNWILSQDTPVEAWVVIDDELFDYEKYGITKHLIQTDSTSGLQPKHVVAAIEILQNK